jgi:pimeloyl-ACP methyl ester carboxylesterase
MTTRVAWKPAMFDLGLPHLLRGVRIPSLAVWSSGDAVVPRSCAEMYRDVLAGRYAEIPGGHMAEYEAPDDLACLVEEFLGC